MRDLAIAGEITADQAEVIAFLSDPASYSPPPERVEVIETHGAMVFLAGELAIKIKRAIRYPYMDFSTLDRRRRACERELQVNADPDHLIYIDVRPITREPDGWLRFGGSGEVAEWAVRMHRFEQSALLNEMAKEGRLPLERMLELSATVCAWHQQAERCHRADPVGDFTALLEGNAEAFSAFPDLFDGQVRDDLVRRLAGAVKKNRALILARNEAGFIRRCHGDLHLRNIVMLDGRPVLFDAIEFDEDLARIDVLYDLAFLLMDLEERRLPAHANLVFNGWLGQMSEVAHFEALALMPVYLATRASIRAKIAASLARLREGRARDTAVSKARRRFDLAVRLLAMPPPRLIAVAGLSGTGKSTLARALAPEIGCRPGAVHLRSDVIRKRLFGVPWSTPLPKRAYAPEVTAQVYDTLLAHARAALNAGYSVIADAVYARPAERAELEAMAVAAGVPFSGLWLEAPPPRLMERAQHRHHGGKDVSDADAAIVRLQLGYDIGPIDWQRLDASGNAGQTEAGARRNLGLK